MPMLGMPAHGGALAAAGGVAKPRSRARVALGVAVEGSLGPLGCHPVLLRLSTPSRLAGASPSALRANSSKRAPRGLKPSVEGWRPIATTNE